MVANIHQSNISTDQLLSAQNLIVPDLDTDKRTICDLILSQAIACQSQWINHEVTSSIDSVDYDSGIGAILTPNRTIEYLNIQNDISRALIDCILHNTSRLLQNITVNITTDDYLDFSNISNQITGQFCRNSLQERSTTLTSSSAINTASNNNNNGYDWSFLFVIFFIFAGGLGNVLVCLAVALDRKLQNVTNYFLFSLAIADLLVSLFVMPLGAIPGFLGYWPFGITWCNIYVTCDVLACSSSILHMCFISLARYLGIRNPIGTRHRSTKRVISIRIALVWIMASMVSSSITVLGAINKTNIMPQPNLCVINNRAFFVFGSLVAFYIPMVTMVVTYALTTQLLKKKEAFAALHPETEVFRRLGGRLADRENQMTSNTYSFCRLPPSTNSDNNKNHDNEQNLIQTIDGNARNSFRSKLKLMSNDSTNNPRTVYRSSSNQSRNGSGKRRSSQMQSDMDTFMKPQDNIFQPNRFFNMRSRRNNLSANAVANEKKATKVLGLVFFTFVICWSPFFVLNIFFAACPECPVPDHIVNTCLWLGYVSSTINPIIYTIFNKTFRMAFIRLLKCNCQRSGRPPLYRSVTEGRGAASLCVPSALPFAISLQGAPLLSPPTENTTPLCDFR